MRQGWYPVAVPEATSHPGSSRVLSRWASSLLPGAMLELCLFLLLPFSIPQSFDIRATLAQEGQDIPIRVYKKFVALVSWVPESPCSQLPSDLGPWAPRSCAFFRGQEYWAWGIVVCPSWWES